MTSEVWLLFGLLALLILLRVPVAVAMAVSAGVVIVIQGIPPLIILQRFYAGTESWVLMAIPFFILSGVIMDIGGLSQRLVDFCDACVGFVPGGMANVNVGASMIFGGISGSAVADTSALGAVLIPSMERLGYSRTYSAAITAVSSPLAMIIPPSIPMVVWSFVSGVSIGSLFLGGVIPGVLVTLALMAVSTVICIRRGYQTEIRGFDFRAFRRTFRDGLIALGAPAVIIGGILSGAFTPTEAAVIAVAYALLVTGVIYRELPLRKLGQVLVQAGKTSAQVMFVVAGATVFSWVLALNQVPQTIGNALLEFVQTPGQFVLLGSLLLFVLGFFLDTTTVILLVGPVLAPLVPVMGLDPIHVGIIFMVMLATGLVTPPLGLCLFVASSMTGLRVEEISREAIPFVVMLAKGLVTPPLGLCLFVASSMTGLRVEEISREAIPFVVTMLVVALILWLIPGTVTWLPRVLTS